MPRITGASRAITAQATDIEGKPVPSWPRSSMPTATWLAV